MARTSEVCKGVGTKAESFGRGKMACPVCGKDISLGYKTVALIKHSPKKGA